MAKSVEGIIGKQIGFDKLGELEVMPSFKGEMRKYPANYEIIRGAIQEEGGGKERSQNTGPAGDPAGSQTQGQCCRAASRGRHMKRKQKTRRGPPCSLLSLLHHKTPEHVLCKQRLSKKRSSTFSVMNK